MEKIAIVTLIGNYNYGNRLQNYAVQEIARKRGYEADTLVFSINRTKELYRGLKRGFEALKRTPQMQRYENFVIFNKKNLSMRKLYAPNGCVNKKIKKQYKFFWVGSDQVWNPEIRWKERDIFFLRFAEKKQRVCISPSIGVSRIDDRYSAIFREGLTGFNHLCCREEDGAQEIRRISEMSCEQLIDPTLVFDAEMWRKFEKEPRIKVSDKYILCFFLGDFNPKLKQKIDDYAQETGMSVYTISDINDPMYSVDPKELVYLLDNATMVFTDSFHITAFSINFKKPFWVFDRYSSSSISNHISSRIVSILELVRLSNRRTTCDDLRIDAPCLFHGVDIILDRERQKFDAFLDMCMCEEQV